MASLPPTEGGEKRCSGEGAKTIAERVREFYPDLQGDCRPGLSPLEVRIVVLSPDRTTSKTIVADGGFIRHGFRMSLSEYEPSEFARRIDESKNWVASRIGESVRAHGHDRFAIFCDESKTEYNGALKRVAAWQKFVVFHWNE